MNVREFTKVVKSFCHQNNLQPILRNSAGTMISTLSNMHQVSVVFTLSEYGEAHMIIRSITTYLGIMVTSGEMSFAHPSWETYAQKIGQMVETYDRNN